MTSLQQIALDFCREVSGWEDIELGRENDSHVYEYELWGKKRRPKQAINYTDLNAVMSAVRSWCDAQNVWIEIHSYVGGHWQVEMGRNGCRHWLVSLDRAFLAEALLAACLVANRKMKATQG